jgi:hypothetical protein
MSHQEDPPTIRHSNYDAAVLVMKVILLAKILRGLFGGPFKAHLLSVAGG